LTVRINFNSLLTLRLSIQLVEQAAESVDFTLFIGAHQEEVERVFYLQEVDENGHSLDDVRLLAKGDTKLVNSSNFSLLLAIAQQFLVCAHTVLHFSETE